MARLRRKLQRRHFRAPLLIRSTSDTIDLQSLDSPSAKDHSRQPAHPAPLGDGPPAPHQAIALKHAEQEATDLHLRSPRVSQDLSGKELQLLQNEGDSFDTNDADGLMHDTYGLQRSALTGSAGLEGDGGEGDGDDGLDDELMDKISSSPSIEDGGYDLSLPWPGRGDSLVSFHTAAEDEPPAPPEPEASSSPFLATPAHLPLLPLIGEPTPNWSEDHHHTGEYAKEDHVTTTIDSTTSGSPGSISPTLINRSLGFFHEEFDSLEDSNDGDFDPEDFRHLLLPTDDPLLDNDFDDASLSPRLPMTDFFEDEALGQLESSEETDGSIDDDDDDTEDVSFSPDSRFVDSGWGGECLREAEDIDFEFVYALHTFVATVEGQANATKGDTMVLLDDSNSYWWLVRVVKDSSIGNSSDTFDDYGLINLGYLPAEHIETPTERLARLNKHRNIDLSQTMLGDNPEKSKNPLKKAMRRRNAKTVQFAAPTYVEASDVDYSTEEEEEGERDFFTQDEDGTEPQSQEQDIISDDGAATESTNAGEAAPDAQMAIDPRVDAPRPITTADKTQSIDQDIDRTGHDSSTSRNGTVRNTDSFFKDDGVETRKINLTPSLLRDDSSNPTIRSVDTRESLKTRPSLESLEKVSSPPGKGREDRSRREKKGMLSGLFKRKDRKGRSQDEDMDEGEKTSEELTRSSPQPKDSSESLPLEAPGAKPSSQSRPQRQTSKLQKAPPPGIVSGLKSPPGGRREVVSPKPITIAQLQQSMVSPPTNSAPPSVAQINIPRAFEEPSRNVAEDISQRQRPSPEPASEQQTQVESPKESRRGMFSPIRDALLSTSPASSEPKPEKVRKAKHRMLMDEFDSDSSPGTENANEPILEHSDPTLEQERRGTHIIPEAALRERLSESPVPAQEQSPSSASSTTYFGQQPQGRSHTPQDSLYIQQSQQQGSLQSQQLRNNRQPLKDSTSILQQKSQARQSPPGPPGLMIDTSSQEEPSASPVSPISSPELIDPRNGNSPRDEIPASTTQSSNVPPPWNDASLRTYLENDSEIRDLLLVVHDKSNIQPAPPDHPVAKNLFKEENRKLGEMSNQLDAMLGTLRERRSKSRRR